MLFSELRHTGCLLYRQALEFMFPSQESTLVSLLQAPDTASCQLAPGTEQTQQAKADSKTERYKERYKVLLPVWAVVLGNFRVAVFGGQGSLVGIEHILSFCDVCHLIGQVVHGGMAGLADFMPESWTSPAKRRRAVSTQRSDPMAAV